MGRRLLLVLACVFGTVSAALGYARSSFSDYSYAQLDQLEQEYRAQPVQDELQLALIERERGRRVAQPVLVALAVLSAIGGFLLPGRSRPSAAEARLVAQLGDPALLAEGARQKAAALLSVTVDAPACVVEAALAAQLRDRDPSRFVGMPGDLVQLLERQREELQRARDLLIGGAGTKTAGHS